MKLNKINIKIINDYAFNVLHNRYNIEITEDDLTNEIIKIKTGNKLIVIHTEHDCIYQDNAVGNNGGEICFVGVTHIFDPNPKKNIILDLNNILKENKKKKL